MDNKDLAAHSVLRPSYRSKIASTTSGRHCTTNCCWIFVILLLYSHFFVCRDSENVWYQYCAGLTYLKRENPSNSGTASPTAVTHWQVRKIDDGRRRCIAECGHWTALTPKSQRWRCRLSAVCTTGSENRQKKEAVPLFLRRSPRPTFL